MEYNAGSATTDDRRTVVINFRERAAPILRFDVQTSVRPAIAPSRKEVAFSGMGKSYRSRKTIHVENFSGSPWPSLGAVTDVAWATASAELDGLGKLRSQALQTWSVHIDVSADGIKPGRYNGVLQLRYGSAAEDEASLPLTLDLAGPAECRA